MYKSEKITLYSVRKNYEDVEDDVYRSITVTKYTLYPGFNGVEINTEHPKF